MPLEADEELRSLLQRIRRIAVLGVKAGARDDAFEVPLYMQRAGYTVLPVNPKLDRVFDTTCVARLDALGAPIDLIDVFRAPRHLPGHVDEILALPERPGAVWFQLGIRDAGSASRLEQAGIPVVQDRCLMVEHRRLCGP
jgi:predicted CoA-binding protein